MAIGVGEGVNFVTADASPDNAVTNGTNLRAAYAAAKLLTPNGAALSATNRAVVFVPPGKYDLVTTALTMDTQFVDLVGVSGNPEHVLITSVVDVDNSGTLVQTANDVLISGVTLENTQNSNAKNYIETDPAAYAPSTNLTLAKLRYVVSGGKNSGQSMRLGIIYSGTFNNCTGGDGAFGGGGTASGTFKDCVGGEFSFGGGGGTASGKLYNCRLTEGTFQTVEARTFTVTIATPGVFTLAGHGFTANAKIRFTTTGALPTGLAVATTYFVIATGLTSNTYQVSATLGGAAINTTGTQSGVHTVRSGRTINCIDGNDALNNQ